MAMLSFQLYIKDHLGNIRAVVNQNDSIEEINHYYPYGSLFGESTGLSNETQPYKYTGKELDRMHGLDMYDYGARLYDPVIARWGKMDNLSEDYYPYSPYNYGLLNPINNLDPDGNSSVGLILKAIKYGRKSYKTYRKAGRISISSLRTLGTDILSDVSHDVKTLFSSNTTLSDKGKALVDLAVGTDLNNKPGDSPNEEAPKKGPAPNNGKRAIAWREEA